MCTFNKSSFRKRCFHESPPTFHFPSNARRCLVVDKTSLLALTLRFLFCSSHDAVLEARNGRRKTDKLILLPQPRMQQVLQVEGQLELPSGEYLRDETSIPVMNTFLYSLILFGTGSITFFVLFLKMPALSTVPLQSEIRRSQVIGTLFRMLEGSVPSLLTLVDFFRHIKRRHANKAIYVLDLLSS